MIFSQYSGQAYDFSEAGRKHTDQYPPLSAGSPIARLPTSAHVQTGLENLPTRAIFIQACQV